MGSRRVALAAALVVSSIAAGESSAARNGATETAPPVVEGDAYKGGTLTCNVSAIGTPVAVAWLRDEAPIEGAASAAYVVVGADVGHELACTATLSEGGAPATVTSSPVRIHLVTTAIADRTARVQRGPTLRFRGRVAADGPAAAGTVALISVGRARSVVVARMSIDSAGDYELTRTIRALVPGRLPFRVEFTPSDPELHARTEEEVAVRAISPLAYPFARSRAERAVVFADGVVPFWSDGTRCAVGCRPAGAIDGWPLKPFHHQHALRAALNERRLSGSHVGIDIMTSLRQPIYALQSGYARILHSGDSNARVRVGNYIYWHVNLRVHGGQYVRAHDTLLGYSFRWMRHLHLSEVAGADSDYLNPLRPGGRVLAPWSDTEPPVIGRPGVAPGGSAVVQVFDPQSFTPRISYETPVLAPAALAYRVFDARGAALTPIEWALRGSHWLPNALASAVYTPQAHSPGFLCFARRVVCRPVWTYRLAGGLAPPLPLYAMHGRVRLTVYAWDWAGNVRARDAWLTR